MPEWDDSDKRWHDYIHAGEECFAGCPAWEGGPPKHTLQSHEAEMPNCTDPDCEFHHPEIREN